MFTPVLFNAISKKVVFGPVMLHLTATYKWTELVAAQLSLIKDATATSTSTRINATVDNTATPILVLQGITLTAQSDSISLSLPIPLKIDRGTAITTTNTTNVANILTSATIFGYVVENINA